MFHLSLARDPHLSCRHIGSHPAPDPELSNSSPPFLPLLSAWQSFILMCKKKGLTESQTTAAFSQIMNSRHETLGLDKLEARRVARRASKAAKAAKVPALPKTQVGDKALLLMGDQELEDVNRDLLPESSKSTVNHKAVAMMGDNKVRTPLPHDATRRMFRSF